MPVTGFASSCNVTTSYWWVCLKFVLSSALHFACLKRSGLPERSTAPELKQVCICVKYIFRCGKENHKTPTWNARFGTQLKLTFHVFLDLSILQRNDLFSKQFHKSRFSLPVWSDPFWDVFYKQGEDTLDRKLEAIRVTHLHTMRPDSIIV